jgi:hypothetical protein
MIRAEGAEVDEARSEGRVPPAEGQTPRAARDEGQPAPDEGHPAPAEAAAAPPPRAPGRVRRWFAMDRPESVIGTLLIAATLLGLIAILLGLIVWPDGRRAGGATASAPLDGRQNATFELADGVGAARIRAVELGGDLYRITTPAGSGVRPRADGDDGTVRLGLEDTGEGGPGIVDVELNEQVVWTLRSNGGTRQTVVDMSRGKVDGVEINGGSSHIELALPQPPRIVPVRLTQGVEQFVVRLPGDTPVRVQFAAGAGQANLDGNAKQGIAPGQSFSSNNFGQTNTGYDIQAGAGVGTFTATRY